MARENPRAHPPGGASGATRKKRGGAARGVRSGAWRWLVGVPAALIGGGLAAMLLVYPQARAPGPAPSPSAPASAPAGSGPLRLRLEPGVDAAQASAALIDAGLLDEPFWFSRYLQLRGRTPQPGSHWLPRGLTYGELAARLARQGEAIKLTLPEGLSRFEIARRLEAAEICSRAEFLRASQEPALLAALGIVGESAEGYLFPATYTFRKDSEPAAVVERMVREFDKRFAALATRHAEGVEQLSVSLGFERPQIVALASMVEREAAVADERPQIASVFLNRLRDPSFPSRLLQSDPSSGYGCVRARELSALADELPFAERVPPGCEGYVVGKILPAMNRDTENVYSTYTRAGVPPGPIANPGAASLEAVLAPAATRFFYFVARGGGRHTFSESYEQHKAAVRR